MSKYPNFCAILVNPLAGSKEPREENRRPKHHESGPHHSHRRATKENAVPEHLLLPTGRR